MKYPDEAYLWQQCTAPCGTIGSWIAPQGTKQPISPVFKDTAKLFDWLRANGWEPRGASPHFRYVKPGNQQ